MSGKDVWKMLETDPRLLGDGKHGWFVCFSGINLTLGPLERGEWPRSFEDEGEEFEWGQRRVEVGMFQGSEQDELYRVCN